MNNQFRIFYQKGQPLRYTATLDMHKIWERWMRRAEIPLSYSQGFHPQPKINQAVPLPLGMLSDEEIVDIWVEESCKYKEFAEKLTATPQPGITINSILQIESKEPAIQTRVHHIEYRVEPILLIDQKILMAAVTNLLNQQEIIRVRRKKEYDLRSLILEVSFPASPLQTKNWMKMILLSLPGKTGRPDEVIAAMEMEPTDFRYIRRKIYLSDSDKTI